MDLGTERPPFAPEPVRRADDGELCGHVRPLPDGTWQSCPVWATPTIDGLLATHLTRADAEAHVLAHGLASLAERWHVRVPPTSDTPDPAWEVCCILESSPGRVRLALGWYSLPGVPTISLTDDDFARGAQLALHPGD